MTQKKTLQITVALLVLAIAWFLFNRRRENEETVLIEDVDSSISYDWPY